MRYAVIWRGQWLAVATWSAVVLHHAPDATFDEDQSRVRAPNAAFVLSLLWRAVVIFAQVWIDAWRARQPKIRATTRQFLKRFAHRDGGPGRLHALVCSNTPTAYRLAK